MALAFGPCGPLTMMYSPPDTRGTRATRTMTAHTINAVAVLLNCVPPLDLVAWRESWQTWRTRYPPKVPQLSPGRGVPTSPFCESTRLYKIICYYWPCRFYVAFLTRALHNCQLLHYKLHKKGLCSDEW